MKSQKHILLGAVMAIVLFCSLGFYDTDYHVNQGIYYDDGCVVYFGSDYDFSLYSDTAGILELDPLTAGNTLYLGTAYTDAINVKWFSDADGDFVTFDEENVEVLFTDVDLQLDDDAKFLIGAAESTDTTIQWDNTNAELDLTVAAGGIHFTLTALPDADYGLHISSTMAGGYQSTGVGLKVDAIIRGAADGHTYASSHWLYLYDETVTAGVFAALDVGVYEVGMNLAAAQHVCAMNIYTDIDDTNPPNGTHYMMRFNTSAGSGKDVPDYWFMAANSEAVVYETNTTHTSASTSKTGAIKVHIVGPGTRYIYLYSDAGA